MLTESLSKENNFTEEKQHFDQTLYWSIQHTQGRTHTHCHCRTAKFSQTECTWVASTVISSQNLLLPQTPVWLLMVQNGLLCVRIFNERHHLGWTRLFWLLSINIIYIIHLYCYILDETFWGMHWCSGCILIDSLQVFWLLFDSGHWGGEGQPVKEARR